MYGQLDSEIYSVFDWDELRKADEINRFEKIESLSRNLKV
jgi:hypothetical protein